VYCEGQPVAAPLRDLARDIVDDRILTLAGAMLGLKHSLLVPIRVEDEVAGSIGFYGPGEMTSDQWTLGESFARQIGLTIENSILRRLLEQDTRREAVPQSDPRLGTDKAFRDALSMDLLAIASHDRAASGGADASRDNAADDPLREDNLFGLDRSRYGEPPTETIVRFADVTLAVEGFEAMRGGERLGLTRREYELLLCFMHHPRQVLNRDQLCRYVWGYDFDGESNFVDVAVKELRKKLESRGQPRLIHTVRGYGYVLRDQ
jgi:two-component system response regulator MprA